MIAKPGRRPVAVVYEFVDRLTARRRVGIRVLRRSGRSRLQEIWQNSHLVLRVAR